MAPGDTDDQHPAGGDRVAELEAELAAGRARIAELEAVVTKLSEQLKVLTEKLGQNSKNSHLPPSSDGPGSSAKKAKGRSKKRPSKRKRGGQKGRRGARRQLLPPEKVDEFVDLFPSACETCGTALAKTLDRFARRYQCLELLASKTHLTEYRRHEVLCERCDHRTLAPYDPHKIPSSSFGPRLTAVVAMLTGVYHLSRRRTQQLLRELLGIELSLGTVSAMEARVSTALVAPVEEAQRAVEDAAVKHTDATGWLRSGILMSLWAIATTMATVYRITNDGCRETIRPLFGMLKGILVSDRATVFQFWSMLSRQICWAHLLRKFVSFSERDGPAGAIGRELLEYTKLIFEYWHGFKDGKLTREELVVWMRPVQHHFEGVLERAVAADIPRLSGSCADMLSHREALWTFVKRPGVEPTNNHAERELRPFVLWRKRSFGSQSDRGLRFAERVMTVAHTARKQGKDVLGFIVRCCTAHIHSTTPPSMFAPAATG